MTDSDIQELRNVANIEGDPFVAELCEGALRGDAICRKALESGSYDKSPASRTPYRRLTLPPRRKR